jgi:hypothetical protein
METNLVFNCRRQVVEQTASRARNNPSKPRSRHIEFSLRAADCAHRLCNRIWAGSWSYDEQRENNAGPEVRLWAVATTPIIFTWTYSRVIGQVNFRVDPTKNAFSRVLGPIKTPRASQQRFRRRFWHDAGVDLPFRLGEVGPNGCSLL